MATTYLIQVETVGGKRRIFLYMDADELVPKLVTYKDIERDDSVVAQSDEIHCYAGGDGTCIARIA